MSAPSHARLAGLGVDPAIDELRAMLRNSRARRIRTMRQFAEQELVLPNGLFAGNRFRVKVQPFTGLWLDAVDCGRYRIVNTTGPTQTGKTMLACGIPVCYHLFEIGEDVVFGLPDQDMADDKWQKDLKPIVESSFPHLLPTHGEGSKGGKVKNSITFDNGATLKFMTGGAGGISSDKGRAGYTARILVVTEKSAFGTRGAASDEANKLEQLRGRTRHYGDLARIYEESTLTTELDPTWQDYIRGTESRIVCPCVYCRQYVCPEREHLVGYQGADDVLTAQANAAFVCPNCGGSIDDEQRAAMNGHCELLHRGQTITPMLEDGTRGTISGDHPRTDMLGFRWSAFQNQFLKASSIATDEWNAARSVDEDDAERKLCQFVWCKPYKAQIEDVVVLTRQGITSRQAATPRGLVPAATQFLTVGIDVHKRTLVWVLVAWLPDGSSIVVDYGIVIVLSDELGEEVAIEQALREFTDLCEKGWTWEGHPHARQPDAGFVDCGWRDTAVYPVIRARNAVEDTHHRYWPSKGFGDGQLAGHSYSSPKTTGNVVRAIGDHYHLVAFPAHRVLVAEFDADFWKLFVQARLSQALDQPGAMRLFSAVSKDHNTFARHITSERQQIEFVPDRGQVLKWKKRGDNHYLDAAVGASVAGHYVGVRVLQVEPPPPAAEPKISAAAITTPDGRPFFILER